MFDQWTNEFGYNFGLPIRICSEPYVWSAPYKIMDPSQNVGSNQVFDKINR